MFAPPGPERKRDSRVEHWFAAVRGGATQRDGLQICELRTRRFQIAAKLFRHNKAAITSPAALRDDINLIKWGRSAKKPLGAWLLAMQHVGMHCENSVGEHW